MPDEALRRDLHRSAALSLAGRHHVEWQEAEFALLMSPLEQERRLNELEPAERRRYLAEAAEIGNSKLYDQMVVVVERLVRVSHESLHGEDIGFLARARCHLADGIDEFMLGRLFSASEHLGRSAERLQFMMARPRTHEHRSRAWVASHVVHEELPQAIFELTDLQDRLRRYS